MRGGGRGLLVYLSMLVVVILGSIDVKLGFLLLFLFSVFRSVSLSRSCCFSISIHYVAVGIYCSITAAAQILERVEFWGVTLPEESAFLFSLILCVIYSLGVEFGYFYKSSDRLSSFVDWRRGFVESPGFLFYLLAGIAFLVANAVIYSRPDLNLLPRGYQELHGDRAFVLFFLSYLPKTLLWSALSVAFYFLIFKREFLFVCLFVVCLLSVFFGANPSTTSRQIIVVGGMPIFFLISVCYYRYVVSAAIWFSVVVVGPMLNYISRDSLYGVVTQSFPFSADFDAMFISSAIIERSDYFVLGFGRYLISAFSFVFPGEFKPFQRFDPLQEYGGLIFSQTNVSLPPFIPPYLDFGLVGPAFFGFLIGLFLRKIEDFGAKKANGLWVIFSFSLMSAYVPFVRGPILGWGPFFVSGVLTFGFFSLAYSLSLKMK